MALLRSVLSALTERPARRSGPTSRPVSVDHPLAVGPRSDAARIRASLPFLTVFGLLVFLTTAVRASPPITLDIPVFAGGYGLSFYQETARQFEALRADEHVAIHIYG